MELKRTPELLNFLSTYISESDSSDPSAEEKAVQSFLANAPEQRKQQVLAQAATLLKDSDFPVEDFGTEANRWFADADEGRTWLQQLLTLLVTGSGSGSGDSALVVKDSNGAPLAEGDSVMVIKDLNVKGGSSDLKRGTLIKKIHLIEDPELIECRVGGSTLVLKTCFLKKA